MRSDEYKFLRQKIGTQQFVAHLLDVSIATVAHREQGVYAVKREAELALRKLYEIQRDTPTAKIRRVTPHYGPKRKR